MPGGDGTGPMGMGPMTGRAAGYCAGNGAPGFAMTQQQELDTLKGQAEYFEDALDGIRKRIEELEAKTQK
jgi:uncharacterized protein DUF5320